MKNLNILLLEDNAFDAELIKEELIAYNINFVSKLVDTKEDFETAIYNFQPDLILSDYKLPQFTGFEALEIAKNLALNIPFILVTGHLSEELAADAIKRGAWDYVLKENLVRLGPAIENALKLKEDIAERKKVEQELIKSEKFNRAITQTAAAAIITTDLEGKITSWNNTAEQLFGYTFSEIINTTISKIIPSKYLKNHELDLKNFKTEETKNTTKRVYELFGLKKDGNEFPIGLSFSNWEVDNQHYVTIIIRDITDRKNAEIKLKKAYFEVAQLTKQLEDENISLKEEISLSFNYEDLVYSSVEISDVLTQVEQVSNTDATVLILGETGTGKELIAKAIHNISDRKKEPLIYVNCAAIPSELIESELFGHKKGSFTGASNNRIGKFQLADKGTLFLDEIGEMPLDLQPKLLRAIQNAEISPIGDSKTYKLDIRIIAATNKNLEKEVDKKRFREDLFFRLNVFPIIVPPLRERIEDIPVLIDYFINKYSAKYRKDIKFISSKTLQQLKMYPWPGNVRELENLVERAVITSNNERLIFQEFDNPINKDSSLTRNDNYKTLEEVQSNHIIKTLNQCNWKISGKGGAALLLDIKPSTLRDRMKKFGIVRPK